MQQSYVPATSLTIVLATVAHIVALAATPAAIAGEALNLDGNVTLTNDYVYRGVSQTMGKAALQLGLDLVHESNFFASLWASNIDYPGEGALDDGAGIEIDFALGYSRHLTRRISADVNWLHYSFPGTRPGFDYDYDEWIGYLTLDENHSVSFGYARNVFGTPAHARYYGASSNYELPHDLSLQLQAGYFDLRDPYGYAYSHAAVALSKQLDPFTVGLSYQFTSRDARALFPEANVKPRLVLTVGVSF